MAGKNGVMETVSPAQYGLPRPSAALKLTPVDWHMPHVYGARWTLCFALPPGADPAQVFESLRAGLAHTIVSIPWLAGHVGPEEASGPDENKFEIADSLDGVLFRYRDLTGDLPAYAEMREQDFPLRHLPAERLFPVGLLPAAVAPARVFAAQANFVAGGLLLSVALHHVAGDAGALQTVLQTWARDTAAAAAAPDAPAGASFSAYDAVANDRRVLMDLPADENNDDDDDDIPEYVLKPPPPPAAASSSSPPPPPPPALPPMETHVFVVDPAALAALKEAAGAYSRHDALCGFLWCALARARQPTTAAAGAFALAVNVRARARPPLPPAYLGNATMLGLAAAAADGRTLTVAGAAAAVRAAVDRYARGGGGRVARVAARLATGRYALAPVAAVLGPDVMATSWADVAVYATAWGLGGGGGAPDRFRAAADCTADGIVVFLPRRPDGRLEMQIGLESGAMARLLADAEFRRLAGGPV